MDDHLVGHTLDGHGLDIIHSGHLEDAKWMFFGKMIGLGVGGFSRHSMMA